MTGSVDTATAGTATVELTIAVESGDFSPRPLNGCFVKNDANLKKFVEYFIDRSAKAKWNKLESSEYLFYSCFSNFQGKVTKAVIKYIEIQKNEKSMKPKECTLENNPLVIAFNGHFFLCCDSEDLNKSKFMMKYCKIQAGINDTLDPSQRLYGLGMGFGVDYLTFISFSVSQSQSQSQSNIYHVTDAVQYGKLNKAGPLRILLEKEKTIVGCYKKTNDGYCTISIFMFEIKKETTSASLTDGPMDLPSALGAEPGQAAGTSPFGLKADRETGEPTEGAESSPSFSGQTNSGENRFHASPSGELALHDQHQPTTKNKYVMPHIAISGGRDRKGTKRKYTLTKPLPDELEALKQREQEELERNRQLKQPNEKLEEEKRQFKQQKEKLEYESRQLLEQKKNIEDYERQLKQEKTKLEEDKRQLLEQKKNIKDYKRQLKQEIRKLEAENRHLKQQNEKLEEDKTQSKQRMEKLEEDKRQLKQQKKSVDEENRHLKQQNEKLEGDTKQFKQQKRKLEYEKRQLLRQKEKLEEDRRRYLIISVVLFVIILLIVTVVFSSWACSISQRGI